MDKNIIKKYLNESFLSEATTPGITVTDKNKKESGKINKAGVKDIEKKVGDFENAVKTDPNSKEMAPNKYVYTDDFEETYHSEMEIMNGQEMIQYTNKPDDAFTEKALEAIEGSSRMGNNSEWANVVPKQQGFSGPDFGKNLVKRIKASAKKRSEQTPTLNLRGRDIQADLKDSGHKPYAIEENIHNTAQMGGVTTSKGTAGYNNNPDNTPKKDEPFVPYKRSDSDVRFKKKSEIKENTPLGAGYTHFAVFKADNKIADGWDYTGEDTDSIKGYVKSDIINNFPDNKVSDFRILSRGHLERNGIDPSDANNWYSYNQQSPIDEMAAAKPPISERNMNAIKNMIEKYAEHETAVKMIDALSASGLVSHMPDSMDYGDGVRKVEALLLKKDFNKAYHTAKSVATKLEKAAMRDLYENDNNKNTKIKEKMIRLKFKEKFNGLGNALKLIPEGYRVDKKIFDMTDGNESYRIRWEGTLSEGKAVVLTAADSKLVNEDINRMKALYGYKSQDTLGLVKGNARINENAVFGDIWNKSKVLLGESEDIDSTSATEGYLDKAVSSAKDAKKHIEGSTSTDKGTQAPKPKNGNWDDISIPQAADAKKHVHLKESEDADDDDMIDEMEEMDVDTMMEALGLDDEEGDEEGDEGDEPETDDSNWAKSDDDSSSFDDKEPSKKDIKNTSIDLDSDDSDDEDEVVVPSKPAKSSGGSLQLVVRAKDGVDEYAIIINGDVKNPVMVPSEFNYIASDKSIEPVERAKTISAKMKSSEDDEFGM
jgi:hypothetical protein